MLTKIYRRYADGSLVIQMAIGIFLGILLGSLYPEGAASVRILGDIFIGALKGIAPVMVFILVLINICLRDFAKHAAQFRQILVLYAIAMFLAAATAIFATTTFDVKLLLSHAPQLPNASVESLGAMLKNVVSSITENPIHALAGGNYMSILTWAIALGAALKGCNFTTQEIFLDLNTACLKVVRFVIKLAPFGIFALVAHSIAQTGVDALFSYAYLLGVLVGTMLFVFLFINPFLIFLITFRNPYPLLWVCIEYSGIFAFLTRSSVANLPVNLALCEELGIEKDLYSLTIPLGSTINMSGAAITIATMSLAAAQTLGIEVGVGQCILLCVITVLASVCASGVPGGSLLLIPLACSVFQIGNDIAAQVIAVGFIIGVVQDSLETALNSSSDVLFTAACSKNKLNLKIK